jgi:cell shape-determining protein MreD
VLGTILGLWQDSLSLCPLGMNGLVKLAAIGLTFAANSYFAIDRFNTRWLLLFACSLFSSLALGGLRILFLNRDEMVNGQLVLLSGLLNATLGLLLFFLFDRIIQRESE